MAISRLADDLLQEIEGLPEDGVADVLAFVRQVKQRRGQDLRGQSQAQTVGSSLDHLFGTWSAEDELEFTEAVKDFESIDESLWQ